jgi:hypothetical protein
MVERRRYTFQDPQPLAHAVVLWLYLHVASVVGLALAGWLSFDAVEGTDFGTGMDMPVPIYVAAASLFIFYFATTLATSILVLMWLYRASCNAHSADPSLRISPPWSVGWYFVPFACCWKPFEAMRQTWQASAGAIDWRQSPVPARLRWWWGLYLVSSTLGSISYYASTRDEGATYQALEVWLSLASVFIDVPLDLVLISIVRDLTALQVERLSPPQEDSDPETDSPMLE